ncbi:phosphopantothenoylcysteine decarboxylase [Flavobacterium sp. SUN052]|uniref:phosphopantothenoylcysteine decarboxylase n=1 Tax=Flavobacterium sp. SUN052 TaxID=3002441 RepID=UPI00237D8AD9|nr:phosphopantothenoylcysteine decarboxylase [Flavobacterium sp. SUN052]MEC4005688.1 phosphopantothenoylcysteine decarboxylase [Flavobacterium sp. SUN052]
MKNSLLNTKILITAGPTREYLDPVRYITNESSGKMGYAIAETLHNLGADVYLVSGPVNLETSFPRDKIINVKTATEMYEACKKHFSTINIAVFCAAVADYTPKVTSEIKIKKIEDECVLELQKNVDIAFEFGKIKTKFQKSIGFALETNDLLVNSKLKLEKKNFDLIVMNSPTENQGFGHDTNKISILSKDMYIDNFELKSKKEVAVDIANAIIKQSNQLFNLVDLSF